MKCKNCEKYFTTATPGHGVCSMPSSYFPTEAENDCCYISPRITCKDCGRFGNDFACFTVDEHDDAKGCIGFIDMQEEDVLNAFRIWLSRGVYSREKVMKLCDEFEETDVYKFISKVLEKEKNN